ncbi:unnamed protein product [Gadus morhua 'NCC']
MNPGSAVYMLFRGWSLLPDIKADSVWEPYTTLEEEQKKDTSFTSSPSSLPPHPVFPPTRHESQWHSLVLKAFLQTSPVESHGPLQTSPVESHGPLQTSPVESHDPLQTSPVESHGPLQTSPVESHDPLQTSPVESHGPLQTSPVESHGPLQTSPGCPRRMLTSRDKLLL